MQHHPHLPIPANISLWYTCSADRVRAKHKKMTSEETQYQQSLPVDNFCQLLRKKNQKKQVIWTKFSRHTHQFLQSQILRQNIAHYEYINGFPGLINMYNYYNNYCNLWRGGVTVRHLGLRSVGRRFKSCSRQRCVTTLGKLFTPMCLCHQAV